MKTLCLTGALTILVKNDVFVLLIQKLHKVILDQFGDLGNFPSFCSQENHQMR